MPPWVFAPAHQWSSHPFPCCWVMRGSASLRVALSCLWEWQRQWEACGSLLESSSEAVCGSVLGPLLSSLADPGWCGRAVRQDLSMSLGLSPVASRPSQGRAYWPERRISQFSGCRRWVTYTSVALWNTAEKHIITSTQYKLLSSDPVSCSVFLRLRLPKSRIHLGGLLSLATSMVSTGIC